MRPTGACVSTVALGWGNEMTDKQIRRDAIWQVVRVWIETGRQHCEILEGAAKLAERLDEVDFLNEVLAADVEKQKT